MPRYGQRTSLTFGTAGHRLADRGLLEASWEPSVDSRPPRHTYRLTGAGRDFVAALIAARSDGTAAKPYNRLSEA